MEWRCREGIVSVLHQFDCGKLMAEEKPTDSVLRNFPKLLANGFAWFVVLESNEDGVMNARCVPSGFHGCIVSV